MHLDLLIIYQTKNFIKIGKVVTEKWSQTGDDEVNRRTDGQDRQRACLTQGVKRNHKIKFPVFPVPLEPNSRFLI